ncbi:MAG: M56 family metallopeptidase [Clostridium sp.]|jgi:beta-lactamase regulating signal transducer with metallopeptidase domain|nr:M56 family metallopeptidase [Clostridium sp.]
MLDVTGFLMKATTIRAMITMTVVGSVLAALMFALKPLVGNRLPKSAQYVLWLTVLAAFLVPASMFVKLPERPGVSITVIHDTVEKYVLSKEEIFDRVDAEVGRNGYHEEAVDALIPPAWWQEALDDIPFVWCFGALLFISVHLTGYLSFMAKLKMSNKAANTECRLPVYRNAFAETPILIGLFCPIVILPDREYTDSELRNIILHEWTHDRRGDVWIKWISLLAGALHWFNPLVCLVRREIERACELACDEAVIGKLDKKGRQSYGDTLIAIAADRRMPHTALSTMMCERKKFLKERLGAIMEHKKTTRLAVIVSAALVLLIAGCAAVLGAGTGGKHLPEATISYEGKSAVLTLGDSKSIPYVELGSVISLNFGEKRPASVSVIEVIAKADGSRKYHDATDRTLEVEYSGSNLATFRIGLHFGDALSSNSADYLPGNAFRWYRIICGDNEKDAVEYGLWLRTDPSIKID